VFAFAPALSISHAIEHDRKKWEPVFVKNHAPPKTGMKTKSGNRFLSKFMRHLKWNKT